VDRQHTLTCVVDNFAFSDDWGRTVMMRVWIRPASLRPLVASGLLCAALAACAPEEKPAPLPPAPIPAAAVAPPPVALSSQVVERAGAFRTYMKHAASISAGFANGPAIEQSLTLGESYEVEALSRGEIAYAAVVALQEPGFVAGVRTYAVDPVQRKALAQRIASDPYYATALPGAHAAAGLIIASLNAEGAKVRGAGERVKKSAYDVQHQAWSKTPITDPAGRLAQAKALSAAPMTSETADLDQLKKAVTGSDAKTIELQVATDAAASAPPYTQVVTRGLAVAAIAALGEGGDDNDAALEPLLDDSKGGFCLTMSKLNLYQCLAVAKPWYEDIFCLGQHVLIDTGQCISKAAGQPQPVQTPLPPTAVQSPPSAAAAGGARR